LRAATLRSIKLSFRSFARGCFSTSAALGGIPGGVLLIVSWQPLAIHRDGENARRRLR
jgi:hypothetical protein